MRLSLRLLKTAPPAYPVDALCIPLRAPYSLTSLLPPPTPLSRDTLTKMHRLSALLPPSTEADWARLEGLDGLAGVMAAVRGVDTSRLERELGFQAGEVVDGRVRAEAVPVAATGEAEGKVDEAVAGDSLVGLAERSAGPFFIVRTPEGIRGKRRAAGHPLADEL